ncbi:MAG TPA: 3-methyl-2-oxobutanoate hydroxymethyltransferase [Acidimicrobiales bacterium]|nr:3-methyl-2-oxobutanoate hydroxymethyltransferase [Acidimicrobiales bacterium]
MKLSAPQLRLRKRRNGAVPLVMVTAYDEPSARFAAEAGVDLILVGDSLANVVLGQDDTLHVTVEAMCHHVRAVAAAHSNVHVVGDMPWMSYHAGIGESVKNAAALIRAGADSVKLEGGRVRQEVVRAILDAQIPVMGHLGLTPQSVMTFGGFKVQAKTREAAERLLLDAKVLEDEGVFAIVIEGVPGVVGTRLTEALEIPTIGIGAGADTDGQVLVFHDLLGLGNRAPAKFVRQYANLGPMITEALAHYAADVRQGSFPGPDESYPDPDELTL